MADILIDLDTNIPAFPVNILPLVDSTDFITIEDAVVYNASGIEILMNFIDTDGNRTCTPITPTSGDDYDWINETSGMYSIEIPSGGGDYFNNDTAGFAWITGRADGVLPFRGPVVCLRPAIYNDAEVNGTEFLPVDSFKPEFTVSGDQLSVMKPDNTTEAYTKTLTTDANAEPIIGSN